MNQNAKVAAGAVAGALIGAAAAYLFLTEHGRGFRDRLEPMVDDLRQEFQRFQRTIEKVGEMANEGARVVSEFKAARAGAFEGSTH